MKTLTLNEDHPHDTINVPDRLVNHQVYFWTRQDHIDTFALNPEMSIMDYTDAMPVDNYAQGNIQTTLLLNHFGEFDRREELNEADISFLWQQYEHEFEEQKLSRQITDAEKCDDSPATTSPASTPAKYSMER